MQPQAPVQLQLKSTSKLSALPKPSASSSTRRIVAAAGETYQYVDALDYSLTAPNHHVTPFNGTLKLAPTNGKSLDAVAHCTFQIDLATDPDPCTLALDWSSAPPVADTYVGLSNWSSGTWEWFQADADGVITLPGWAAYKDANSQLLVSLLVMGDQRGLLRGIKLGKSEERGTGAAPDETAPPADAPAVDDDSGPMPPLYSIDMPSAVDLSALCGPVRDQGSWQSCTAFAFGDSAYSMILNDLYGRLGWDVNAPQFGLSPKYLYVISGQRYNCPDTPDYFRGPGQVADSLRLDGIALEQNAPYDFAYNTNWASAASDDAKKLRIDIVMPVQCYWDAGRAAIKGILWNAHRPLEISINIDQAFCSYVPGTVYTYHGPAVGSHEMCIVGFDDAKQAYLVRNSWGGDWGMGGCIWISYETFDSSASSPSCYMIDDAYDAKVVARFLPFGSGIAAPAALQASNGTSAAGVDLTWQPVAGASGYRIYRDSQRNLIADTESTTYTDTTALEGYSHLYWVTAYDSNTESAHSSVNIGFRQTTLPCFGWTSSVDGSSSLTMLSPLSTASTPVLLCAR